MTNSELLYLQENVEIERVRQVLAAIENSDDIDWDAQSVTDKSCTVREVYDYYVTLNLYEVNRSTLGKVVKEFKNHF